MDEEQINKQTEELIQNTFASADIFLADYNKNSKENEKELDFERQPDFNVFICRREDISHLTEIKECIRGEAPVYTASGLAKNYARKARKKIHIEKANKTLIPELEKKLTNILDQLISAGVPISTLHDLLDSHINLSRIAINDKYDIMLPDYDSVKIKMRPLPKTVFLLYLKHPEGIAFTELQDHFEELIDIYSHVTNSDDMDKIKESIEHLVNPFDNSISEKCSAIRTAFSSILDPSIAKYYCITGRQGQRKYIKIDRDLVMWNVKF